MSTPPRHGRMTLGPLAASNVSSPLRHRLPSPDPWSSGDVQHDLCCGASRSALVAETAFLSDMAAICQTVVGGCLCLTHPKTSRWVMPVCCTHPELGSIH
ncbi:hypothetical protein DPMN_115119 [Dreissena polymorpha]|uniref:Uncharacterized protein n=1 Tax=Dreissena polymorpha TaxID=45954 RepID=A0A9D4KM92_DREPO|nr:hypothetical protein DPMN_115119 [Dreissena polymorpha]